MDTWVSAGSLIGVILLGILLWMERSKRASAESAARASRVKAEAASRANDVLAEKEREIHELEKLVPPSDRFDRMFDKDR